MKKVMPCWKNSVYRLKTLKKTDKLWQRNQLRIDPETHDKLYYIAEYKGRSGNGQVLHLIRRCIEDFEKEHGKIDLKEPSAIFNLTLAAINCQLEWSAYIKAE